MKLWMLTLCGIEMKGPEADVLDIVNGYTEFSTSL